MKYIVRTPEQHFNKYGDCIDIDQPNIIERRVDRRRSSNRVEDYNLDDLKELVVIVKELQGENYQLRSKLDALKSELIDSAGIDDIT